MMPVAVLCGGLATRMYPVTKTLPKSLIEVAGEPFIFRQLRLLAESGVDDVVLCAGRMGEMIRDQVGDGGRFSVRVRYSFDGERQLGTAGALKKALPLLGEDFLILYGDSFLECDYAAVADAFARAENARGMMTVYKNDNRFDTSNIVFRDGRIIDYDKKARTQDMEYIDYGLGALRAEALSPVAADVPTDLADVYRRLLADGTLAGYVVETRFYEIGSPSGLAELERHIHESSGS